MLYRDEHREPLRLQIVSLIVIRENGKKKIVKIIKVKEAIKCNYESKKKKKKDFSGSFPPAPSECSSSIYYIF